MSARKFFSLPITLALIFAILLAACSGNAGRTGGGNPDAGSLSLSRPEDIEAISLQEGKSLHVVATTSIVADVVANVGGDAIELTTIVPRMIDPHGYQVTPGDLRSLHDADVVFINGLGLEEALEGSLLQLPDAIPIVSLSDGILLRKLDPGREDSDPQHVEDGHGSSGIDPHVWFDPLNILIWNENAAQSLAALDPTNETVFTINAAAFRVQLEGLHEWILDQFAGIPEADRKFVTDHLLMGYFAQRYDFEVLDALLPAFSSAASPSAQELAGVQDSIRQSDIKAIFISITTNPQLAEQMARDTSAVVIPLYTGSLSEIHGPASTYLAMMQYNVSAIAAALK